jgi:RNA polymerase sigma factor (sigma-70 family)
MQTRQKPEATDAAATYVEALFRKHRGQLLRYLSGLLPNPADAAELVQETYLRLLRQQGLERIEANARGYVFQIATNLVRDYFRQRELQRVTRHIPLDTHSSDSALLEPSESVEQDATLARFKAALMQLRPEVREVFLLHRFRDMTYPEIASHLGIGVRTAERYTGEAIGHLKQTLEWDL